MTADDEFLDCRACRPCKPRWSLLHLDLHIFNGTLMNQQQNALSQKEQFYGKSSNRNKNELDHHHAHAETPQPPPMPSIVPERNARPRRCWALATPSPRAWLHQYSLYQGKTNRLILHDWWRSGHQLDSSVSSRLRFLEIDFSLRRRLVVTFNFMITAFTGQYLERILCITSTYLWIFVNDSLLMRRRLFRWPKDSNYDSVWFLWVSRITVGPRNAMPPFLHFVDCAASTSAGL